MYAKGDVKLLMIGVGKVEDAISDVVNPFGGFQRGGRRGVRLLCRLARRSLKIE